jgi:hypothetical protein
MGGASPRMCTGHSGVSPYEETARAKTKTPAGCPPRPMHWQRGSEQLRRSSRCSIHWICECVEHVQASRDGIQRRQAAALHMVRGAWAAARQGFVPGATDPPGLLDLPSATSRGLESPVLRRPGGLSDPPGSLDLPSATSRGLGSPVLRRPGGPICCAPTKPSRMVGHAQAFTIQVSRRWGTVTKASRRIDARGRSSS